MKIKINVELTYDTETGQCTSKVISKDSNTPHIKTDGAMITLETGKIRLSKEAAELMEVSSEDRVTIQYEAKSGKPTIAKDSVLGSSSGNKVSKSLTVVCRGKCHDKLAEFGTQFKLEAKSPGIFLMIGDKDHEIIKEADNIKIKEKDDVEDLKETMKDLEDLQLEDELVLEDAMEINFNDLI